MLDFCASIPVFKRGYRWDDSGDPYEAYITTNSDVAGDVGKSAAGRAADSHPPRRPSPNNPAYRFYDPFIDERQLFRAFADLPPYPWPDRRLRPAEIEGFHNSILTFVNRYGKFSTLKPIWDLPREARLMRAAIELWDAIIQKDEVTLDKYLHFFEAGEYRYSPYSRGDEGSWRAYVVRQFGRLKDLHGWGLRYTPIAEAINDMPCQWHSEPHAKKHLLVCARDLFILLLQSRVGKNFIRLRCLNLVRATKFSPLMTIRVEVEGLLDALWVQLAVSLIENEDYRRCKMCHKPYAVGSMPNGKTVPRDKLFCNDTCRVRWFQDRQRRARKMRSDGAALPAIAKALGTDTAQIKTWVGEAE